MEKLDSLLAYTDSVVSKAEAKAKEAKKEQERAATKSAKEALEGSRDEDLTTRILEEEEVRFIQCSFLLAVWLSVACMLSKGVREYHF